jgi:hypothetical protein
LLIRFLTHSLDGRHEDGSYEWPDATLDSERFRYKTCEEALAALTQSVSKYERRGVLKTSFVEYKEKLTDTILAAMDDIIDLDEDKEKQIGKLILDAIRIWLFLCTQRCRIMIVMPGSQAMDNVARIELAEKRKLLFTTRPELQRWGSASGIDLEEKTVVCEGEVASPGD